MKNLPQISVIIPVYNTERYLQRCLDSVLEQTYRNLEIILIDDGSVDSSSQICDMYEKKDPRITLIHQENKGIGATRNTGLDHATGEYILFVDSDDYIAPEMIECLVQCLQNAVNQVDVILFCYDEITAEGVKKKESFYCNNSDTDLLRHDILTDRLTNFLWNKMYRRTLWNGIRFPVGHLYEDLYIHPSLFLQVRSFISLPDVLYHYNRINDTSITGKNNDFSSWGRYNKFLAYQEHERVADLVKDHAGKEWAEVRCLHEGIKTLYINYYSKKKLKSEEKTKVIEYLKKHSSPALGTKYKILQIMATRFSLGLHFYGLIRYCQICVKDRFHSVRGI